MHTVNTDVLVKLKRLLYSLSITKEEFELIADEVEDCKLKTALNGLSMESYQYASELCNELKGYGIYVPTPEMDELVGANSTYFDAEPGYGNELMFICKKTENYLFNAYRNILSEYFPIPDVRNLLLYQLNALKCAFMKVNLLNSARYSL